MTRRIVVVGAGMVGYRLVSDLVEQHVEAEHSDTEIVLIGEEPHDPYDRVHLSSHFDGAAQADLTLVRPEVASHPSVTMLTGVRVEDVDAGARTLRLDSGRSMAYDELVLATGSYPFVPPVPGSDRPGCFTYRTLDDLDAIRDYAQAAASGVVIGGGLLGLEAANALRLLGVEVTVIEFAPRLMPAQLDEGGARALRTHVERLGIHVRVDHQTASIDGSGDTGAVSGLRFTDGSSLDTDLVVFSAGIRPRDELAQRAGLAVGERGGVVVDDACRTTAPHVWAIGECALVHNRIYGLVAPGYEMAAVVADRLAGGSRVFAPMDLSTKLKLLGVEVASLGQAHGGDGLLDVVVDDPVTSTYQKVVVDPSTSTVVGGVLVGDAAPYGRLLGLLRSGRPLGDDQHPRVLLAPPTPTADGPDEDDLACTCNTVTYGALRAAVRGGCHTVGEVTDATRAGSGCGSCLLTCKQVLDTELEAAGVEVDRSVCAHFPYSRQELFDLVRVQGIRTFSELLERHGTGTGCEVCKPTVASILATQWNEHVLERDHRTLQDSNDRYLANIQKDGTYSVVPRVPGGEITPAKLLVLAEVARDFDLYTKITGGQRIDLFGARLEQLPEIWQRLTAAGFESGHAYAKGVRTVKSCVGSTWCRYGVQDSTALAIALEQRYRGLRSPHKLKFAVSGCSRECAEAQSKDVGVIATEQGWNLYVCGNGGMRPRHAVLLASDLDTERLVQLIDRFLMFYVRTADKLQRTAPWLEELDGGIEHLRRVVVSDSLGLAEELESAMHAHVASYRDEWAATLEDPDKLGDFRHFVNADAPDPALSYVRERGQRIPLPLVEVS